MTGRSSNCASVTFHDGDTFNAEDAKFSLERLINPDTVSPIVELGLTTWTSWTRHDQPCQGRDPIIPNKW